MAFHNALAAHHDQVCAEADAERAEHAAENAEKAATFAAMGKEDPAAQKAAKKRATSDHASESSTAPTRSPLAIRRGAAAAK
ncbi:MAG: hypothetical protein IPF92_15580 [Myxococcales bacterium]|nr:hypothetical protein [Myxococcales bacterium]HQY64064.1 hypothetical protein [Polyangiaceae bacterium]